MGYRKRLFACLITLTLLTGMTPVKQARSVNGGKACSVTVPEHLAKQYFTQYAERIAQAKAWATINRLSGKESPSALYAQLSALPKNKRKRFYSTFTGMQMSSVWLIHFAHFEIDNALTPEQKEFINELRGIITGRDFEIQREEILQAIAISDIAMRSDTLFGKDGAKQLLSDLGGPQLETTGEATKLIKTSYNLQEEKCALTTENCQNACRKC